MIRHGLIPINEGLSLYLSMMLSFTVKLAFKLKVFNLGNLYFNPAGTRRPGDVSYRSSEDPNAWDLQGTSIGRLGDPILGHPRNQIMGLSNDVRGTSAKQVF